MAYNEVAERNARLTEELRRVRRTAGRDGRLTERLDGAGAEGAWAEAYDDANALLDDLVRPVTEVARVIEAVAEGDLSPRIELRSGNRPLRGEFLRIGRTVNAMVDQLALFTAEVTRVAREVGTEGNLGGQAKVRGVSRQLEGPHRLGELDGVQPHQPGPRHRPGHHCGRQRRPLAQDHGRREGRALRAEEHHQHDGRPAVRLRRRGDPRGPRGRHRGQARRSGRGARRRRHLEGPHRQRQRHGRQPHRPGPRRSPRCRPRSRVAT